MARTAAASARPLAAVRAASASLCTTWSSAGGGTVAFSQGGGGGGSGRSRQSMQLGRVRTLIGQGKEVKRQCQSSEMSRQR